MAQRGGPVFARLHAPQSRLAGALWTHHRVDPPQCSRCGQDAADGARLEGASLVWKCQRCRLPNATLAGGRLLEALKEELGHAT